MTRSNDIQNIENQKTVDKGSNKDVSAQTLTLSKGISNMKKSKRTTRLTLPNGAMFVYNGENTAQFDVNNQQIILFKAPLRNGDTVRRFYFDNESDYLKAVAIFQTSLFSDTTRYLHTLGGITERHLIFSIHLIPDYYIIISHKDCRKGLVKIDVSTLSTEEQQNMLQAICAYAEDDKRFVCLPNYGILRRSHFGGTEPQLQGVFVINSLNQKLFWLDYTDATKDEILQVLNDLFSEENR